MHVNKHFGFSGKGYYIALILCAAAIGISGYLYYQNSEKTKEVTLMEQQVSMPAEVQETGDVAVIATEPGAQLPAASGPAGTEGTAPQAAPSTVPRLKTAAPVDTAMARSYAMESLSYNETTRDWRVHNGVDYSVETGTPVTAAADGTVYTTYSDDLLGTTVVVRHIGGYTTHYSSLSPELPVKAGDQVRLGQTLGYAADTALVESAMGSHVHFSVSYQDVPMDPLDFFALD